MEKQFDLSEENLTTVDSYLSEWEYSFGENDPVLENMVYYSVDKLKKVIKKKDVLALVDFLRTTDDKALISSIAEFDLWNIKVFIFANKNTPEEILIENAKYVNYCDVGYVGRTVLKNPSLPLSVMEENVSWVNDDEDVLMDEGEAPNEVIALNPALPDHLIVALYDQIPAIVSKNKNIYINASQETKDLISGAKVKAKRTNTKSSGNMIENLNRNFKASSKEEQDRLLKVWAVECPWIIGLLEK